MMCDVMPTISEDGSNDRESSYSGDDANFEQLMVNMLDERDKLMETLRESQEQLQLREQKFGEIERERDALQKQLAATGSQVKYISLCTVLPVPSSPRPHTRQEPAFPLHPYGAILLISILLGNYEAQA